MMREQYIGDPAQVMSMSPDPRQGIRRGAHQEDQHGQIARSAERRAADEPVDRLHHRGRQGPQRLLVHQLDRALLRSAIVSNKTGILLQNRAGGFRIQPGHPNCIAPGKRPLHTIIPSLATKNGRAVMPFGVMGGQYQPVGQTHVLTNMLDYGCDVQEAIDMPRGLHYEGVYQLEDSVPADIVEGLKKIGHKTTSVVGPLGGGQAIWIDWEKGTLTGGSDPRKDGCALGY
jgi:hypothetical protein